MCAGRRSRPMAPGSNAMGRRYFYHSHRRDGQRRVGAAHADVDGADLAGRDAVEAAKVRWRRPRPGSMSRRPTRCRRPSSRRCRRMEPSWPSPWCTRTSSPAGCPTSSRSPRAAAVTPSRGVDCMAASPPSAPPVWTREHRRPARRHPRSPARPRRRPPRGRCAAIAAAASPLPAPATRLQSPPLDRRRSRRGRSARPLRLG